MHYIIYLIIMGFVLLMGTVTNARLFPQLEFTLNFHNLINFYDPLGIVFMLAVCLIALLGTKSLRPLKDAFVFLFSKQEYSAEQKKNGLLAVKTTMLSAFAAGFVMFLISVVNVLKSMDLSGGASMVGVELSKGLLTPIYALVIVFILLPLYVELKRSLTQKAESGTGKQHIAARGKRRKAG